MNAKPAALASLILIALAAPAAAQDQVFRSIDAVAGKQVRIALVGNVSSDCKVGPTPEVRIVTPPKNGALTVRSFTSKAGNLRRCPQLEVPAQGLFYFPKSTFSGADEIVYEVKRADRPAQSVTVKIDVAKGARPSRSGEGTDL